MTTFLFIIFFTVILVGLGWSVVRKLDSKGRLNDGERLILSFAVGCYAIYFGVFAIGHFRLDGVTMWSLFALCVLAAIPGWQAMPWRQFKSRAFVEIATARRDGWSAILWITVLAIGLSSLIQGLAPPNDYDSLIYQLLYPQIDVEFGRIGVAWRAGSGNVLFPTMASNLTRILLVIMDAGAAQMIHGVMGLVAAMAAAAFALRLGYSKYTALIGAIFFHMARKPHFLTT